MSAQRSTKIPWCPFTDLHFGLTSLAAALLAGCASDSLTLPKDGDPAFVTIVHGNGQQALAGTRLGDSLIIMVTDGASRPVTNQAIAFVPSAGGSVEPASVLTNGEGKAVFRWVLGPAAGEQTLEAALVGESGPKVTFIASAVPGPVKTMAVMAGDGQFAPVGTPLPQPLSVRLLDKFGNSVSGAVVRWQVSAGRLSHQSVTTASDGSASVVWTLGPTVGTQTATATFQGATGSPVRFSATASVGASPRLSMEIEPSSQTESGEVLSRQPAVQLESALGLPLLQAGISVTAAIASGGGILTGTTSVKTNSSGIARFTDLALTGSDGSRTLIFAAPNFTPAVSASIRISTTGPSAQQTSAQVSNGRPFRWTTITITTRDAAGGRINQGGFASMIKVSVSGANTNSSLTVFDQGDGTYEASYFPIFKGTDMIAVTLGGAPIKGSPFQSRVK